VNRLTIHRLQKTDLAAMDAVSEKGGDTSNLSKLTSIVSGSKNRFKFNQHFEGGKNAKEENNTQAVPTRRRSGRYRGGSERLLPGTDT
jgi:hypothetical protein